MKKLSYDHGEREGMIWLLFDANWNEVRTISNSISDSAGF